MKKDLPVLWEFMLVAMILMPSASAVCPLGGCGSSGNDAWLQSAQEFLSSDVPLAGLSQAGSVQTGSFQAGEPVGTAVKTTGSETVPKVATDFVEPKSRTGLFPAGELLAPLESFSSRDVIVDVSNQRSEGEGHIKGAIGVPAKSFLLDDGSLRPVSDLAAILGAAGISQEDAVIVYSDSFSSGEATFVLWLLRYLGQDDVKALDGGLEDWIKASLPLETKKNVRSPANYSPSKGSELLASYDFVKSGAAQMVDARTFQDFGNARILKAYFINPEQVLESGKLKDAASLTDTFAKLDQKKPVEVYSNDYFSASLVWYALQLMGFDSRLYTWEDWQAHGEAKVYEIK
ncbi:Putative thiosulfate sulfurtransferase [uncultured archaeon]|nr:Putative thiosulfate sulfurtransferase [uncultured archaeon]